MTSPAPPQTPLHRVTLFFGPEPVDGRPGIVHCVFNVKKRSWRAGIQVTVELPAALVSEISTLIDYHHWLSEMLTGRVEKDQAGDTARAHDALVQVLCQLKLELALNAGIRAENQCLSAEALRGEVLRLAPLAQDRITSYIAAELDLTGP